MIEILLSTMRQQLAVVMPVYNDWESMERLVCEIDEALAGLDFNVDIFAIDDGSTVNFSSMRSLGQQSRKVISSITIVRLVANVGHQRAIATGLVKVASDDVADIVAVMDSDGEDKPTDLARLLKEALRTPGYAIVAQRKRRSEGVLFRFFYVIYTKIFRILTGHSINFGNFVVMPVGHVRKLIYSANIWNNFPSALVFSKLPMKYLETARGHRYFGKSKMNFVNLVAHGLGAVSVFSEAVFIRILVGSMGVFILSLVSAITAVIIRVSTETAIPGWTTNALGFALLVSMQAVLMPIMMAFLLLNNRSSMQILPTEYAPKLIAETCEIYPAVKRSAGSTK